MVNRYKQTHKKRKKTRRKKQWATQEEVDELFNRNFGRFMDMRNQERGRKIGGEKCQIVLKRLIGLCI